MGLAQHFHNNRQPIGSHLACGLANAFVLTVNTDECSHEGNAEVAKAIAAYFVNR